ncbi:chromosome segregation protein SMC, partial [bacterium]
ELLKNASSKTQIIITTHSDFLIDQFTETPEDILVFDKNDETGTTVRRFSRDELKDWLEDYRLGQAWLSGAIGGTRW